MKDKKVQNIGIIFKFSPNWLGGIYYIINIINSLEYLDQSLRPKIFLFYKSNLKPFISKIRYTNIEYIKWDYISEEFGYPKSLLFRKNYFVNNIIQEYDLDGIYPLNDHPVNFHSLYKESLIAPAWFADLQHIYYPKFFSKKQLLLRELRLWFIRKNASYLVVSSNDVANNFRENYKLNKNIKIKVLQFCSVLSGLKLIDKSRILQKYDLPKKYFIVSNQFHKHKNHETLFKAIKILVNQDFDIVVAVTGKIHNKDNQLYIDWLLNYVNKNNLQKNIRLLDVIPRNDQLSLMKYSSAVIQPSLFEGWSTVIEDAKSLQVPVIASDIQVNIEQLGENGFFFDKKNPDDLARSIQKFLNLKTKFSKKIYEDYSIRVNRFALQFLNIFSKKA